MRLEQRLRVRGPVRGDGPSPVKIMCSKTTLRPTATGATKLRSAQPINVRSGGGGKGLSIILCCGGFNRSPIRAMPA